MTQEEYLKAKQEFFDCGDVTDEKSLKAMNAWWNKWIIEVGSQCSYETGGVDKKKMPSQQQRDWNISRMFIQIAETLEKSSLGMIERQMIPRRSKKLALVDDGIMPPETITDKVKIYVLGRLPEKVEEKSPIITV